MTTHVEKKTWQQKWKSFYDDLEHGDIAFFIGSAICLTGITLALIELFKILHQADKLF